MGEEPFEPVAEVVEDAVTVVLKHACVRVETGVAELSDLLCQKFDSVGRVTEDNGLVDLELVEEGVQAVDLLLLLYNILQQLEQTAHRHSVYPAARRVVRIKLYQTGCLLLPARYALVNIPAMFVDRRIPVFKVD